MKFFDHFHFKYVINLSSRKDRLTRVQKQFEKAGVLEQIKVFPGVVCDSRKGFPSEAARGCFLSHFEILKEAKEKKAESVLIMEDDLIFSEKLFKQQEILIDELEKQNWDMCYWSYCLKSKPKKAPKGVFLRKLCANERLTTTAFYSVHGSALDRLIMFLEAMLKRPPGSPEGGPMPVDGAYNWYRKTYPGTTFISIPALGSQGSSRSDITPDVFHKWPIISTGIDILHGIKSKIFYN